MGKTKDYTDEQERIARYAKAMGHPARMAIRAGCPIALA